ncbi:MAG: ATP-binding protein [Promethearchaeota archaeon]
MINKDHWIKLIKDFAESPVPSDIKQRTLQISENLPLHRAISIIGPRRCGKTYEMYLLIQKLLTQGVSIHQILYLNFESIELIGVEILDMRNFIDIYYAMYPESHSKELWFFLDEIQVLQGWEVWVRSLLDKGIHIYLSGSSSKLLSKEIATQMRGRNLTYEVYPLSFHEYLEFHETYEFDKPNEIRESDKTNEIRESDKTNEIHENDKIYESQELLETHKTFSKKYLSSKEEAQIKNLAKKFVNWGGYPEVCLLDTAKEKILREIIEVTIQKDVMERYHLRNGKMLKLLFKALINSKQFSLHKFYNYLKTSGFKVSKNTLYEYLEHLKDAMILYTLKKFAYSYKEEESTIPKIYFIDNGLLRISGVEDRGRLLENCVFIELLRRLGEENIRYFTKNGREVDFIIKKGTKVEQLIQVSYSIDDFQTKDREFRALIMASEDLKCKNLLLVTWDHEGEEEYKGKKICIKPLWKWLLHFTM